MNVYILQKFIAGKDTLLLITLKTFSLILKTLTPSFLLLPKAVQKVLFHVFSCAIVDASISRIHSKHLHLMIILFSGKSQIIPDATSGEEANETHITVLT